MNCTKLKTFCTAKLEINHTKCFVINRREAYYIETLIIKLDNEQWTDPVDIHTPLKNKP